MESIPIATEKSSGLTIDLALYRGNSKSLLIHISGTHGTGKCFLWIPGIDVGASLVLTSTHNCPYFPSEGYVGSAVQSALLSNKSLFEDIPEERTSVLFVHALNPFGMAFWRRWNEVGTVVMLFVSDDPPSCFRKRVVVIQGILFFFTCESYHAQKTRDSSCLTLAPWLHLLVVINLPCVSVCSQVSCVASYQDNIDINRNCLWTEEEWREVLERDPNIAGYETMDPILNPPGAPSWWTRLSFAFEVIQAYLFRFVETKRAIVAGTYSNQKGVTPASK